MRRALVLLAALVLGVVTGFTFSWARMTDPATFHQMLSFESPRIYLLMGAAVAVAFVGLPVRRRAPVAAVGLGLLVIAQFASLAAVAGRFYA